MIVHQGGCHCGRVRFEVTAQADIVASECNCSICAKSGYLALIVPKDRFKLIRGEGDLTTYRFNTGVARHLFCSQCGIKSFYVPRSHPDGISVNVRCLDPGPSAERPSSRSMANDGRSSSPKAAPRATPIEAESARLTPRRRDCWPRTACGVDLLRACASQ